MKRTLIFFSAAVIALMIASPFFSETFAQNTTEKDRRLQWFRDAKFGLFIHWGIYAIPAGEWDGKIYPGASEWVLYRAMAPVEEYRKLASRFNPVEFNADEWAKLAHDAGMKYLVITSKHHDGFAMYHSQASAYNIVDTTPFKRDPMKELAEACAKYNIKLCFYYSQTQDWNEPNGIGNDWDFGSDSLKNFTQYYQEKVIPQVREILTQYGPIGLIWFDTPRNMTAEQSKELADLVHELQPDCLVDGRIGNNMGDYQTKGDNRLPSGSIEIDWETPATMNHSWGYKESDHDWKSTKQLIRALVEVTAKGGNYLLNVGPTAKGTIPQPSVDRLRQVGDWLKIYGDAIYDTRMSPWVIPPEWGMITVKGNKLYLHVFDWPSDRKLLLLGLRSRVKKASLLGGGANLTFTQNSGDAPGQPSLSVDLPVAAPNENVSVVVVEFEGKLDINPRIQQEQSGAVNLYGLVANFQNAQQNGVRKDDTGIRNWVNTDESLAWDFAVERPGKFRVLFGSYAITTGSGRTRKTTFERGHQLELGVAGKQFSFTVDSTLVEQPSPYFTDIITDVGEVTITTAGNYTLSVKARQIKNIEGHGCVVRWVRLQPIQ